MKRILTIIFIFVSVSLYSQRTNLSSLEGTWEWKDNSTDSEFVIILKKINFNWPQILGGALDSALVGGYKYKKNGIILHNNIAEINHNFAEPIEYSIWINDYLGLSVRDYLTANGRGEYKYLLGQSKIIIVSENNPMQIRWIINDNSEQVVVVFDNEDPDQYIFPKGTALPSDIVLTKVESGVE